jgi:hypothetical protein
MSVKAVANESEGFAYLRQKFPIINEIKLNEEI